MEIYVFQNKWGCKQMSCNSQEQDVGPASFDWLSDWPTDWLTDWLAGPPVCKIVITTMFLILLNIIRIYFTKLGDFKYIRIATKKKL